MSEKPYTLTIRIDDNKDGKTLFEDSIKGNGSCMCVILEDAGMGSKELDALLCGE